MNESVGILPKLHASPVRTQAAEGFQAPLLAAVRERMVATCA